MTSFRHEFPSYLLLSLILWVGVAIYTILKMKQPLALVVLSVVGELVAAVVLAVISTVRQIFELENQREDSEKAAAVTEQHIRVGETTDALIVDLANIPVEQWREAYRQLVRRTSPRSGRVLLAIVTLPLAAAIFFGPVYDLILGSSSDGLHGWVQWLIFGVFIAVFVPIFLLWARVRGVIVRNKPPCLIVGWVDDIVRAQLHEPLQPPKLSRILADKLHIGPASVSLKQAVRFTLDEHGALHRQDGPAVDELIWTSNRFLDHLERGTPEGLLLNGQGNAVLLLGDVRGGHWPDK
jgi:hypothetical protein